MGLSKEVPAKVGEKGEVDSTDLGDRKRVDLAALKADLEVTLQESAECDDAIGAVESGMVKITMALKERKIQELLAQKPPPESLCIGHSAHRKFIKMLDSFACMALDTDTAVETWSQLVESTFRVRQLDIPMNDSILKIDRIKHKLNENKKVKMGLLMKPAKAPAKIKQSDVLKTAGFESNNPDHINTKIII